MGRTRQDRTKIKEEKKKRQNSDYEASLKDPQVRLSPPILRYEKKKWNKTNPSFSLFYYGNMPT